MRSHEIAQEQLRTISGSSNEHSVHTVNRQQLKTVPWKTRHFNKGNSSAHGFAKADRDSKYKSTCDYGGNKAHTTREACPAKGKQCKMCDKWNHFAKACRSKVRKTVHTVSDNEPNKHTDDEDMFIDAVTQQNDCKDKQQVFAEILVGPNKSAVRFKLDMGASTNIIPTAILRKLGIQHTLQPSSRTLYGYGGEQLAVKGKCNVEGQYKKTKLPLRVHVVETNAPPVLGLKACLDFKLIKLIMSISNTPDMSVMEEFSDVFKGIGLFPGECNIHIEPNAAPVIHPPRRVPIALRDRLRDELKNMENQQIITKVTEPTEWVNSMVATEKLRTGKLRVCLDPKDLNKVIKRPHSPLPTLEDITCKLAGACYFSVMDARSGYWAIKLTEESSKLTTFNTVFGRYRFLHLPFGFKASKEFDTFASMWEFKHITSSPYYPQSNGLAEKAVQIAKSLMQKAKADHKDPYLAFLEYRNTPVDNFKTPSQLLMSRRLRSILPCTHQQLKPKVASCQSTHAKRVLCQNNQKRYYNRSSKPLNSTCRTAYSIPRQWLLETSSCCHGC